MARKRPNSPVEGSLALVVGEAVDARQLGPEDAPLGALAVWLASTLDGMDAATRERMAGQTAGQLLSVLRELSARRPVQHGSRWRADATLVDLRARAATRRASGWQRPAGSASRG
jgi:hypothetical protein